MSDIYNDFLKCRVALAIANREIDARGDKKKIESLKSLDAIAQVDVQEAAQILGINVAKKYDSGNKIVAIIAAVMFAVLLIVVNQQNSEIGRLSDHVDQLEDSCN